jgi:transmembrane sensor
MGLWPSWTEMRADYRTKTGEQRDIMLAAGMSVRMNTQTSIAIRHSDENTERVELVGGEASFSTSAGGARALAVLAADGWITADMAQFDVRFLDGRTGRSVCVTCLKGTLKVERGRDVTTITTGQQLRYRGGDSERVDAVDPELISAWQRGVLIFRFTPLQDAVSEINRYRPGLIVVVNPQLGRLPVSGRFRIDDLNEILARIEEAFGAKVRSLPGGLVLLS